MTHSAVMAGLVPAIHALIVKKKQGVDARDKRGHDESTFNAAGISPASRGAASL
jgi:hypothetical protein